MDDKNNTNHNLLIFTDRGYDDIKKPYQHWNAEVDRMTPKGWETPESEKGVEWDKDPKTLHDASREILPKSLPPEFCPLCGSHTAGLSITKSRALHVFNKEYPGINVKRGDSVEHYIEDRCYNKLLEGRYKDLGFDDYVIDLPDDVVSYRYKSPRWVIEDRIIEFIQAQHMKGHDEESAVYGDDTRKERFADKEDV